MKKILPLIFCCVMTLAFTSCQTTLNLFGLQKETPVEDISTLFVEQKNSKTAQNEIIIPDMNNYPVRLYITKGFLNPYRLNLEVTYEGNEWVYTKKVAFSSRKKSSSFGTGKCEVETQKDGSVKEVYSVTLTDAQASSLYYTLLNNRVQFKCEGKHISTKKRNVENKDMLIYTIKYYAMISNITLE